MVMPRYPIECLVLGLLAVLAAACQDSAPVEVGDVDSLGMIIRKSQDRFVQVSRGESFTEEDYQRFVEKNVPSVTSCVLKGDRVFVGAAMAFNDLPGIEQERLLAGYRQLSGPSSEEVGVIGEDDQAQARQRAERLMAAAIADTIAELSRLSRQEIQLVFERHRGTLSKIRCASQKDPEG